jgi:hypothetical protein
MSITSRFILSGLLLLGILPYLCLAGLLTGGFLFDDFGSLAGLQNIDDFSSALTYVMGGAAGPSGRPLASLSFLLNASAWPADPSSFLFVNLFLHIANVFLVWWLVYRLAVIWGDEKLTLLSVGVALLWAVLPNHVSTVGYVVQRMTILAMFFSLLSLISATYVIQKNGCRAGYVSLNAMLMCLLFAVLSKENAASIVFILWALFYKGPRWLCYFFGVLSVLIVLYLLSWLFKAESAYMFRDFSLAERLVAQSYAILLYIESFLWPEIVTAGVFTDTFRWPSDSAFIASIVWLFYSALIFIAVRSFGVRPNLLSLGVLIFFSGHLIESTVIPLELYYEHRNYYPYMGLCVSLFALVRKIGEPQIRYFYLLVAIFVIVNLSFSFLRANLWGEPFKLAMAWNAHAPASERAADHAASQLLERGQVSEAMTVINESYNFHRSPVAALQLKFYSCTFHARDFPVELNPESFSHIGVRPEVSLLLMKVYAGGLVGRCGVSVYEFEKILESLMANPAYTGSNRNVLELLRGYLYLDSGSAYEAEEMFKLVLSRSGSTELLQLVLSKIVSYGHCESASRLVEGFREKSARAPLEKFMAVFGYEKNEPKRLQAVEGACKN